LPLRGNQLAGVASLDASANELGHHPPARGSLHPLKSSPRHLCTRKLAPRLLKALPSCQLARLTSDSIPTIHNLTRDFVIAYTQERGDSDPIHVAVRLVSEALCSVEDPEIPSSWPLCAELTPHLRRQISNNNGGCSGSSFKCQAAIIASQYLHASGYYHAS
jgi:hypothetical protein